MKYLIIVVFFLSVNGKTITILSTCDIHGHVLPSYKKRGGILKIATFINKMRQKTDVVLIDSGDTIQGSFSATFLKGKAMIKAFNYLKYDAFVLGNHELDFGLKHLSKVIKDTKVPVLAANFSFKNNTINEKIKAWRIVERQGIKIAIIGLQASFLKNWFVGKDYDEFNVVKACDMLEKTLKEVHKQNPNMIIVAAHHGLSFHDKRKVNEVYKICQNYSEIDLFLGGHTHQDIAGRMLHKTYYVQAGKHGENIAVIKAEFDDNKKLLNMKSHLAKIDDSIKDDETLKDILKEELSLIAKKNKEKITTISRDYTSRGSAGISCQTTELIASSIKSAYPQIDAVLHGTLSSYSLYKGDISYYDIYRLIPYENRVFTFKVSKDELYKILLEQQQYRKKKKYFNNIHHSTIHLDIKNNIKLTMPKEEIVLACNSYVAAGAGFYPYLSSLIKRKKYQIACKNTRELVIEYLKKQD